MPGLHDLHVKTFMLFTVSVPHLIAYDTNQDASLRFEYPGLCTRSELTPSKQ